MHRVEQPDQCWEYALASYTGLAFIHIKKTYSNTYEVFTLQEHYFKERQVSKFIEYERDKFLVALYKDDSLYLL